MSQKLKSLTIQRMNAVPVQEVQLVWRRAKVVSLVNLNRLGSIYRKQKPILITIQQIMFYYLK